MGLIVEWPTDSQPHADRRTASRCGVADDARTRRTVAPFKVSRRLRVTAANVVRRFLDRVAPDPAAADEPRRR